MGSEDSGGRGRHRPIRIWPAIGAVIIAIAGLMSLAAILYRQVSGEMLARNQQEQGIVASQQAARLEGVLRDLALDLVTLSNHPDVATFDETRIRPHLLDLHRHHQQFLVACSVMNEQGVLAMVEGSDRTGEGRVIRDQAHVVRLFETGQPVVSGSFLAVQRYYMVAVHAPILVNGKVRGSVVASIKWDAFGPWFRTARTAPGSSSALLDPDGRVIYHPSERYLGEDLASIPIYTGDGDRLPTDCLTGDYSGVVTSPFFGEERQVVAVKTFNVSDRSYAVVVSAPYANVLAPIRRFTSLLALYAGFALLVLAGGTTYVVHLFYRDKRQSTLFQRELEAKIEALRQAEERLRVFREVFEHSRDGIAIADESGCYRERNLAHETMAGQSPADNLGGDTYLEVFEALRSEGIFRRELVVHARDGEERTVDLSAFTVPGRDGDETFHVGISRDITERKRAEVERARLEDQLRQSEKLRAIGQLAGGIAHDFNNQLTGILGHAELLRNSLVDPENVKAASAIMQAGKRAADLTQQLLAYARKGRHQSVSMDLHGVIEEVVSILERSLDKRIRIALALHAERHVVVGDPTQIQNAVLNLALNARDAMPDGGELRFATTVVDDSSIELRVSDTGVGIEDDIRDRIFEPFFTTKAAGRGTGMGLAAVYGTIRGHGGAVEVDSAPGQGTTFRVALPLSEDRDVPKSDTEAEAPRPGSSHILVIDDEDVVLGVVSVMLGRLGYRVTCCRSGRDGVARYRENPDDYDLVLLDLIMPLMGGRETFAALRKIRPDVKVIIITGFSTDGEAQQLLDAGALSLVQKPFRHLDLTRALAEALG